MRMPFQTGMLCGAGLMAIVCTAFMLLQDSRMKGLEYDLAAQRLEVKRLRETRVQPGGLNNVCECISGGGYSVR